MEHPVGVQVRDSVYQLPKERFDKEFRNWFPFRVAMNVENLLIE